MFGTVIDKGSSREEIGDLTALQSEVERCGGKFIGGYEADDGHVLILKNKEGKLVMAFAGEPENPRFKSLWSKWKVQTGTQIRLIHDRKHIEEICQ